MHWTSIQYLRGLFFFMLVFLGGFFLGRGFRRAGARSEARRTWKPDARITDADIAVALRAGRKSEAIKLYRQRDGSGLRDAKRAVEAIDWHFRGTGK